MLHQIITDPNSSKYVTSIQAGDTVMVEGNETAAQNLERRCRKIRNWVLPSFVLFGFVTATVLFGWPSLLTGSRATDAKTLGFQNQLTNDYALLKGLLFHHFASGDAAKTSQLMKEFFDIQKTVDLPYTGLVLLDGEKRVFDAYSATGQGGDIMRGSSYVGIPFKGPAKSIHKVLSLYRPTKKHPMGVRGLEIAFELPRGNKLPGWLVFQMNVEELAKTHGLDEKHLQQLHFKSKDMTRNLSNQVWCPRNSLPFFADFGSIAS